MDRPLSGMTGFARAEGRHDGWSWVWEARSVNGRGLEVRFRLPPGYDGLEPGLRDIVKSAFTRGNIQFSLNLGRDASAAVAQIDADRLNAILNASELFLVSGRIAKPTLDGLLAIRGVLKTDEDEISEAERDALDAALRASFAEVVEALRGARREEGKALEGMLSGIITEIESLTADAARCAAGRPEAVREKLKARLDDLVGGDFPEDRLLQEIALLASKADVREEIDRLGAHISGARDLLAGGSPVGRKLDFLSQEFNRETNTLCSKSGDSELTRIGLAMKAAVEQFREQVQNVE
tara:strand:- start:682 stop:1569 length:888 start_codon:yes stop_codon:yes gene_type:complete